MAGPTRGRPLRREPVDRMIWVKPESMTAGCSGHMDDTGPGPRTGVRPRVLKADWTCHPDRGGGPVAPATDE
nr:hypothetical protein KPHV_25930 [Kitasatospora purpeofusca]